MNINRNSGILLHVSSLYNKYGIGDFGPAAYAFVDYLSSAGIGHWQMLPLNYTDGSRGFSPYSCISAFAGNPLYISPEILLDEGLLLNQDIEEHIFEENIVEFDKAHAYKTSLLNKAFDRFEKTEQSEFKKFCTKESYWLNDFALFITLKNYHAGAWWLDWPSEFKNRNTKALNKIKKTLAYEIQKEKFIQFQFFKQLKALRAYCTEKHIQIIGDIPFYVSHDSSDVWTYPELFKLLKDGRPAKVSGVPPDMFTETGQLWGTPVYNWTALKKNGYAWWINRLTQTLLMCDILRLDHFRAFSAYYEIPAAEHTAMNGKWVKTPGNDFFKAAQKYHPELPFIAEDLGEIDQPVWDLMKKFEFPGMKILQFAFMEHTPKSIHSPHNYEPNCIVYTGTHDNNTIVGWFNDEISDDTKNNINEYFNKTITSDNVNKEFIRTAVASTAVLSIWPLQDMFGLGSESKMNRPGTMHDNWKWRIHSQAPLTKELALEIRNLLSLFNRLS